MWLHCLLRFLRSVFMTRCCVNVQVCVLRDNVITLLSLQLACVVVEVVFGSHPKPAVVEVGTLGNVDCLLRDTASTAQHAV